MTLTKGRSILGLNGVAACQIVGSAKVLVEPAGEVNGWAWEVAACLPGEQSVALQAQCSHSFTAVTQELKICRCEAEGLSYPEKILKQHKVIGGNTRCAIYISWCNFNSDRLAGSWGMTTMTCSSKH